MTPYEKRVNVAYDCWVLGTLHEDAFLRLLLRTARHLVHSFSTKAGQEAADEIATDSVMYVWKKMQQEPLKNCFAVLFTATRLKTQEYHRTQARLIRGEQFIKVPLETAQDVVGQGAEEIEGAVLKRELYDMIESLTPSQQNIVEAYLSETGFTTPSDKTRFYQEIIPKLRKGMMR